MLCMRSVRSGQRNQSAQGCDLLSATESVKRSWYDGIILIPNRVYTKHMGSLDNFLISISFSDVNCIQVRAPQENSESNCGIFNPGEHIGHITKEFSFLIAPILDMCEDLPNPAFECHLQYSDTNHTRFGYDVDVVITICQYSKYNQDLFYRLEELKLNPSWF